MYSLVPPPGLDWDGLSPLHLGFMYIRKYCRSTGPNTLEGNVHICPDITRLVSFFPFYPHSLSFLWLLTSTVSFQVVLSSWSFLTSAVHVLMCTLKVNEKSR
jgi:hypothetical protein